MSERNASEEGMVVASSPGETGGGVVRVQLFSVLRERLGQAEVRVTLDGPVSGATLLDRLADMHPTLADYRKAIRLAVGERYVDESATVRPGDDVALITAVSGG